MKFCSYAFLTVFLCLMQTSCALPSGKALSLDSGDQVSLKSEEHFREHAVKMPSVLKIYSVDRKPSKQINGLCFISASSKSFFDMPCVGVYITLLDKNNKLVFKVKADEKGRFRFSGLDMEESYHLGVKSTSYKTLSEKVYVTSGADILLELVER